jgi:hypothetical protein
MNIKLKVLYFLWISLGYKRGLDNYHHSNPSLYLYKNKVLNGLMASIMYASPVVSPFVLNKEIFRLEVYIRNLEDEKNKTSYYDLY